MSVPSLPPTTLPNPTTTLSKAAPRSAPPLPKFCRHKATGQAYVLIRGQRVYLGKYESPEALEQYHRLMAEMAATGGVQRPVKDKATISDLLAAYWTHAEQYYRMPSGDHSSELDSFRQAVRPLRKLYGTLPIAEFGPKSLIAVRQQMIEAGWCRTSINRHVGRLKTIFRWGTQEELVNGDVYHALQSVAGLKKGRCAARESKPVKPVPREAVDAVEPFVSRQVNALIRLQLFTAARPGELLRLRPCDIDRSGKIWSVTPDAHKTAHHGHGRTIYFGPRAQEVLAPYLLRMPEAYLFSPKEAEAERLKELWESRITLPSCGNRPGLNKKLAPERTPGEFYDLASYRRAISRACDQAFPPPPELDRQVMRQTKRGTPVLESRRAWSTRLSAEQKEQLKTWRHDHRWHPHQLRHNAATELRKEFGIEVARLILGHRSAAITEVYAEMDAKKALEVMARVG